MFTPFLSNYAYGWGVRKIDIGGLSEQVKVISHTGGINGFNTIIFRLVKDKHLIVLFNNTGRTNLNGISQSIAHILYGQPVKMPKKSIVDELGKTILTTDVKNAIKQYHELKAHQHDHYYFEENDLNVLGYQLLGIKKYKEAIEIFKLNIHEYPNAYNPYDSLGEAYMLSGEKELAIKNYAKSLELNPKNTNAILMLKKIMESE